MATLTKKNWVELLSEDERLAFSKTDIAFEPLSFPTKELQQWQEKQLSATLKLEKFRAYVGLKKPRLSVTKQQCWEDQRRYHF